MVWRRRAAIGCFLVALAGVGWIGWESTRSQPVRGEVVACRDRLRSDAAKPGSISWPGGESVDEGLEGDSIRTVFGLVKGEDVYGAELRTRYECQVQRMRDGGWQVIDVK